MEELFIYVGKYLEYNSFSLEEKMQGRTFIGTPNSSKKLQKRFSYNNLETLKKAFLTTFFTE